MSHNICFKLDGRQEIDSGIFLNLDYTTSYAAVVVVSDDIVFDCVGGK